MLLQDPEASKSYTSKKATLAVGNGPQVYIVYSKPLQKEAEADLSKNVYVTTIHSYAYRYVMSKNYRLPIHNKHTKHRNLAFLKAKDLSKVTNWSKRYTVLQAMESYFASDSLDINKFFSKWEDEDVSRYAIHYIEQMFSGALGMTHSAYLKYFHLLLAEDIIPNRPTYDLAILDECLTGDMFVKTNTGNRHIKDICTDLTENKKVFVTSFNQTKEIFETKEAINPLISKDREILEIKTEGLNTLKCTPNHKILTQKGYVQAKDLIINQDYLLLDSPDKSKTKYLLNTTQLQVVLGSYLGDGYLTKQSKLNTYRLKLTQGEKQLNYLKWKANSLTNNLKLTKIKSGYTGKLSIYQANASPTFILDDSPFELVLKNLDTLGLAIWLMDDGSVQFDSKKKNRYLTIHSNNFSEEENIKLALMLSSKFGLNPKVLKSRTYFYLAFNKQDSKKLIEITKEFLHGELKYKFGISGNSEPLDNKYKSYGGNFITSIKPAGFATVYDFEVKDNHNFLTSKSKNSTKTIVHNCQDISAVSLAIYKLTKSHKYLVLGDDAQAIYGSFTSSINAFDLLKGVGVELPLSKSFRVNAKDAKAIEGFCQMYIKPNMRFTGMEYPDDPEIKSHMYIAKTNSMLISKMIQLIKEGKAFSSAREPMRVFELPLALLSLKKDMKVFSAPLKFLERDMKKYYSTEKLRRAYPSPLKYVLMAHQGDPDIKAAFNLITSNGPAEIFEASKRANEYYKAGNKSNTWVSTAHSSKGLTMDMVTILPDLNEAFYTLLHDSPDPEDWTVNERELALLMYVVFTRARHKINNAVHLNPFKEK